MKKESKQIFLIIALFGFLFIPKYSYAQLTTTEGSLLRVNFFLDTLDSSDRVCLWKDYHSPRGSSSSEYAEAFQFNGNQYFIGSSLSNSWVLPGGDYWVENCTKNTEQRLSSYFGILDIIDPYMFERTRLMKTKNGWWVLNGELGIGYIDSRDSLLMQPEITDSSLMHICGKVGNKFLIVLRNNSVGLAEITNPPNIDSFNQISVEEYSYPQKIKQIEDSLYFMHAYYDLYLVTITDQHIQKESVLIDSYMGYFNNWFSINRKFYYVKMGEEGQRTIFSFVRSEIDVAEKKLVNETELIHEIDRNSDFSEDGNYFVSFSKNSVKVYSIAEEKIINSYDLSAVNYVGVKPVFIDSPYVYVHVIDKTVGVEDENKLPEQFSLSQNYPNPFNPETTIEYTIPNVETRYSASPQHVTLKVYDILGREVATLVNEYQSPGKYTVQFNVETRRGESLPSGIYFYTLRVGDSSSFRFSELQTTKKMILLK